MLQQSTCRESFLSRTILNIWYIISQSLWRKVWLISSNTFKKQTYITDLGRGILKKCQKFILIFWFQDCRHAKEDGEMVVLTT